MSVSILGLNIKKIRESKDLNAYQLSKLAGVGVATISEIESGVRQGLNSRTIEKIATVLEVKSDDLFKIEDGQSFTVMDMEQTVRAILVSEELTLDDITMTDEEKQMVIDSVLKTLDVIRENRKNK